MDFISMKFDKILSMFEGVIYHNMKKVFKIFCHAYWLDHQCYDAEAFIRYLYAIKSGCFEGFVIWSKIDKFIINIQVGVIYKNAIENFKKFKIPENYVL